MPSLKQKETFKNTLENGGIVSRAAKGIYSDSMAKNPQKITNTKGWEELLEQNIPDKLLAEKHRELLNAEIKTRQTLKGELVWEEEKMDSNAVSKGLDMGYKLKGRYAPEKTQSLVVNIEIEESEETKKMVEEYENKIREILSRPKIYDGKSINSRIYQKEPDKE